MEIQLNQAVREQSIYTKKTTLSYIGCLGSGRRNLQPVGGGLPPPQKTSLSPEILVKSPTPRVKPCRRLPTIRLSRCVMEANVTSATSEQEALRSNACLPRFCSPLPSPLLRTPSSFPTRMRGRQIQWG